MPGPVRGSNAAHMAGPLQNSGWDRYFMSMHLDLHIHTTAYSRCSKLTPDAMAIAAKRACLDGVCVTEHNRIWKEREARALEDKHGIAIFRGMEVTTTGGDIIVFGLEEEPRQMWIPAMPNVKADAGWPHISEQPLYPLTPMLLKAKVDAVRGVAIAAHPFRRFRVFGVGELPVSLAEATSRTTLAHVHGIEVHNSMDTSQENDLALKVADAMGLLKCGGSDAHTDTAVGACVTRFDEWIHDERELVEAILGGRFIISSMSQ